MSRCATRLYNLALEQRRWHWLRYHHTRPGITYAQQNAQLVELKEAFPEFKMLYSLVAQEVLRLVQKNFNSFFGRLRSRRANGREETARPPRFKSSRYFFTLCYVQSGFALEGGRLVLSGGQGRRERIAIAGARWSASPTSRAWCRRIPPKGRVTQKSTARCRTTGRW